MKPMGRLITVAALLLLFCSPAAGHKVNLFAYAEGGRVYVEGYFADGKPAETGKITVLDGQNSVLLEGVTDKEGKFSFEIPKVEDLTIVLDAGMGHKTSFVLKKADLETGK